MMQRMSHAPDKLDGKEEAETNEQTWNRVQSGKQAQKQTEKRNLLLLM